MTANFDLSKEQYRDSSRLSARAQIYRYSTNPQPWFNWVADNIKIDLGSRVLEPGCGTGALWKHLLGTLPEDADVVLSDLSPGMLQEARQDLSSDDPRFSYRIIDAMDIPYEAGTFQVVIANHMLYHVPDLDVALSEFCRVLQPGGVLYATTVGNRHLADIKEWLQEFDSRLVIDSLLLSPFTLENCQDSLLRHFEDVEVRLFPNELKVPSLESLLDYALSMLSQKQLAEIAAKLDSLASFLETKRSDDGHFLLPTATGMAIAKSR